MKSIQELNALREQARASMNLDGEDANAIRVVVGLATCGIAAGATPVFTALQEAVEQRKLNNVNVIQTGCIGMCQFEPIVEVLVPGQEKVTYGRVTPEVAARIAEEHLAGGTPVADYTIGNLMK